MYKGYCKYRKCVNTFYRKILYFASEMCIFWLCLSTSCMDPDSCKAVGHTNTWGGLIWIMHDVKRSAGCFSSRIRDSKITTASIWGHINTYRQHIVCPYGLTMPNVRQCFKDVQKEHFIFVNSYHVKFLCIQPYHINTDKVRLLHIWWW